MKSLTRSRDEGGGERFYLGIDFSFFRGLGEASSSNLLQKIIQSPPAVALLPMRKYP